MNILYYDKFHKIQEDDDILSEVLKIQGVSKRYQAKNGEIEALKDVTFSVNEGELVSLIGPSGCGKSTLLSIVARVRYAFFWKFIYL